MLPWRNAHEFLGELDCRFVGETGEHHVVEAVELVAERGDDARMAMTEQAGPPRTDRIEIAASVGCGQPRAVGARDRQHRQGFVVVHLRARVPHDRKVAGGEVGSGAG